MPVASGAARVVRIRRGGGVGSVACPKCRADNPAASQRCQGCGARLWPDTRTREGRVGDDWDRITKRGQDGPEVGARLRRHGYGQGQAGRGDGDMGKLGPSPEAHWRRERKRRAAAIQRTQRLASQAEQARAQVRPYNSQGICPADSSIRCSAGIVRGVKLLPCGSCGVLQRVRAERPSRIADAQREEQLRQAANERAERRRRKQAEGSPHANARRL